MKMGIQSKRNAAESQRKKSPNRRSLIRVTNFERLLKIWTRKQSRLKRLRKSVASGWKRLSARKSSRLKRNKGYNFDFVEKFDEPFRRRKISVIELFFF